MQLKKVAPGPGGNPNGLNDKKSIRPKCDGIRVSEEVKARVAVYSQSLLGNKHLGF